MTAAKLTPNQKKFTELLSEYAGVLYQINRIDALRWPNKTNRDLADRRSLDIRRARLVGRMRRMVK